MKKALSVFLVITVVCTSLVFASITVNAGTVIENAIAWAEAIANDDSQHGYSQTSRWGPDYDCSSLVITAFNNAGVSTGGATYTENMISNFEANGFTWIPWSTIGNSSNLQRGDILLNIKKHTAIYMGNNQVVEAHGRSAADKAYDNRDVWEAKTIQGDQDGQEIRVTNNYWYSSGGWDGVLRYNEEPNHNPVDLGDDFYAMILNTESWKPISLVEGSDRVYLKNESGTSKELWHFIKQEDRAYVIYSCYNGKALEMHNGERKVCTQLSAHDDFWGGYYQQWYIFAQGDGYVLKSKHYTDEDWVMDLYAANPRDGNIIQINHRNNSTAQVWSIYKDAYRNIGDNFNATIYNSKYQNYISKVEGTNNVFLQEKNNTAKQLWHFNRQSDGAYSITSCFDNKALEMTNGTRENGTQVSAFDNYWGGYYQQWYFLPFGDGYKLLSKHYTSERWFLDRSARTTEDGNIVQIYENYGFDDQVWCINKNNEYADLGNEFNATISNVKYQNYVSKVDGTNNIFLLEKKSTAKQLWHFIRQSDGAYAITSCYDNKALEMTNGTRENGTQISAFDNYWGGYYQQWYLLPVGKGYRLLSKHYTSENWYLDRSARTTENGNIIQIYELASEDDQVFSIVKNNDQIPVEPVVFLLGDIDGDGEATIIDATYIQRYNVNMKIPVSEETLNKCGDVDGDGEVSVIDATYIQRFEVKIPTPYLIGEAIT